MPPGSIGESSILRPLGNMCLHCVVSCATHIFDKLWFGCSDGTIAVLNNTATTLLVPSFEAHKNSVNGLVAIVTQQCMFSLDRLSLCGWDLEMPTRKVLELKKVGGMCMVAVGESLWIGESAGLTEVRCKARKLKIARTVALGEIVSSLQVENGTRLWAMGSKSAVVVDAQSASVLERVAFDVRVSSICLVPDEVSGFVWVGCSDGSVRRWDRAAKRFSDNFPAHGAPVSELINLGGHRIVSCSIDGSLSLWDWRGRARLGTANMVHGGGIFVLLHMEEDDTALSHSLARLVSAGGDGFIRVSEVP